MDELTKQAIEAKKGKLKPINDNPEIDGGVVKETELPKGELKETKSKEPGNNQIKLGKNKIVTIKPWTGKTKKKIRKFFEGVENPEDIDFIAVIKTLLYDYIKEDVYLNEGEQQYLLMKIREISIDTGVDSSVECPICYTENQINTTTDKIIHYKENQLPFQFNENIELIDIESLTSLEKEYNNFVEDDDYDGITTLGDVESALHIKIQDKNLKEVIDYLDNASIKETQDIFNKLRDLLPKCELYYSKVCKNCNDEVKFEIDVTESIFESLLQ